MSDVAGSPPPASPSDPVVPRTRTGWLWVTTAAAIVVLVLLIVFIAQNGQQVDVNFLAFAGSLPLGLALLVAAVIGAALVAIAGSARVLQLRLVARRNRNLPPA